MNQPWAKVLPPFIRVRLEGRPNLRTIFSNTSWLFADRVLRIGVGLFVNVWVARYLGPEQFGLYSYAIAFVSLFGAFVTLGLDGIVVRDIVRDPASKDELLGTAFTLKLTGGFVALLITYALIVFMRPTDSLIRWLVGIVAAGMIFQTVDTIDLSFQAQVESRYTVLAKNPAFGLITLVKIALIQAQAPLIAFAWAGLAEIALGAAGLVVAYRVNGYRVSMWRPTLPRAKVLLKESWPLSLAGVAIMIYVRIDQVMLGEMVGDQAVGIYSAAVRLSELWYFVPIAIVSSVSPSIIAAKKRGEAPYYKQLEKTLNLMVALAYAIAIPMTFLSKYIVVLLFGVDYAASSGVLAIHIWQGVFVFLGVARGVWIVSEGLTKSALATTSFGAVLNILLNLYLIPLYGPVGAAIATIVSYATSDYLIFILYPYLPFRKIGWLMTKALTLQFLFSREQTA